MTLVARRAPEHVMTLARMGSSHQHRLSFMRILLRRMKSEQWAFTRPLFAIDDAGVGTALYAATTPERTYTLVAFAHDLPADQRSDRVIATAWDATFALFDGTPSGADIERLRANVPLQEAGRIRETELTLSRANRSERVWEHVVTSLASGHQPDAALLDQVGYLMRTTAVYGSGKFGAADRSVIAARAEMAAPFQAEMLTVFLIRAFVADLVDHLAAARSPQAIALDPQLRRRLGIGNSTGLGMAPFLLSHPRLINNWVQAREEALRRVRSVGFATAAELRRFDACVDSAGHMVRSWQSDHPAQGRKIDDLVQDLARLRTRLEAEPIRLDTPDPWDRLICWSQDHLSIEGQELVASLVMEPYGELVDELAQTMHADETAPVAIDGTMIVRRVRELIETHYSWALAIDWDDAEADARAWYVSQEKLEPRLGERHREPIGDYEQPLQPGRDVARLYHELSRWDPHDSLARALRHRPEHRHAARRLMTAIQFPYAEIRDNTIGADLLPTDLLRAKLSFFGATHFDPRSDRWIRINMFRGAPMPTELADADPDGWAHPAVQPAP